MIFAKDGVADSVEATLAIAAIGWLADTAGLNLTAAGVATTDRGYVQVDEQLRTTAPHIFAAGTSPAGSCSCRRRCRPATSPRPTRCWTAATAISPPASPIGSFTDPEYAQVGPDRGPGPPRPRRRGRQCVVRLTARPIIDGRTDGFCKLIVDRGTHQILGCHVVGERAVEMLQVAAVAIAAAMPVEHFARIPLSFPTYTNVLGRAAPPPRASSTYPTSGMRPSRPRAAPDRRRMRSGGCQRRLPSASQGGLTSSPTSSIWA